MAPRSEQAAAFALRPEERAGIALLSVLLLAAPMMVGTVHPATTVALAGLSVVALWVVVLARIALPRSVLGACWLGVALWSVLTLVPLPAGFVDSPSLSCSPGPTALGVVKMVGATAVLAVAGTLWSRTRGQRAMLLAVVGTGSVVAAVSGVQTLLGAERVLGLYTPSAGTVGGFQTPFVNPNHAAQYFELIGFVAIGAAARSSRGWRVGLGASGAVLLGAALATGSGGVWFVVPAGLALILGMDLARRRRWIRWFVPALTGVAVVAGLMAGAGSQDPGRLLHSSKLAHVPAVLQMIADHPLCGVGRGGFRDAFAAYSTPGDFVRYTHAESEPLHLLAELGVPVATLLMVATLVTWWVALARWRRNPAVAGALAGTFAVGLHSLVEFGLEFGGVGLPFAVVLAALLRPTRAEPSPQISRRATLGVAVALTAALALGPLAVRHGSWARELRAVEGAASGAVLDDVVRRAVRWHPCSADVAYIAGHALLADGRPAEALRFLERASQLDPHYAAPHLAAAQALENLGERERAAAEVGAALQAQPELGRAAFEPLHRLVHGSDEAIAILGGDLDLAAAFALYLEREHPGGGGLELAARIAETDPEQPTAARVLAAQDWAAGHRAAALARLAAARSAHPCDVDLVKYEASLLRSADDATLALEVTREGLDCAGADVELHYQEVMSLIALQRYGEAQLSLRHMRDAAVGRSALALTATAQGRLAAAEGRWQRAEGHYLESLRHRPDRVHVRLELGKVYRELGRESEALEQFERVREESSAYPFLDDWIRELRASAH